MKKSGPKAALWQIMVPEQLCRFALNRAKNSVPCFIVHGQVVLFATMLLDLWHDFLFAISADLPVRRSSDSHQRIENSSCLVPVVPAQAYPYVFLLHFMLIASAVRTIP
jgi:hypothetical protein